MPALTSAVAGGILDRRLPDLHLHRQSCWAPPSCISSLTDNFGDSNLVWGYFQECSQIVDQICPEELFLSHGWEVEGQEQNRRCAYLDRLWATKKYVHHFVVLVKKVGAMTGVETRNILTWGA